VWSSRIRLATPPSDRTDANAISLADDERDRPRFAQASNRIFQAIFRDRAVGSRSSCSAFPLFALASSSYVPSRLRAPGVGTWSGSTPCWRQAPFSEPGSSWVESVPVHDLGGDIPRRPLKISSRSSAAITSIMAARPGSGSGSGLRYAKATVAARRCTGSSRESAPVRMDSAASDRSPASPNSATNWRLKGSGLGIHYSAQTPSRCPGGNASTCAAAR
jgi:hypothetical protein